MDMRRSVEACPQSLTLPSSARGNPALQALQQDSTAPPPASPRSLLMSTFKSNASVNRQSFDGKKVQRRSSLRP